MRKGVPYWLDTSLCHGSHINIIRFTSTEKWRLPRGNFHGPHKSWIVIMADQEDRVSDWSLKWSKERSAVRHFVLCASYSKERTAVPYFVLCVTYSKENSAVKHKLLCAVYNKGSSAVPQIVQCVLRTVQTAVQFLLCPVCCVQ